MGVDQRGKLAGLLAQHVADHPDGAVRAGGETVASQPRVAEHLGQIAAAGVGQQHHDDRLGVVQLGGQLDRRRSGHAGRPTDQQRLLTGQPTTHRERVGVGDGDDAVADGRVVVGRPEVLPHTLDQVGPTVATGVDRAHRVRSDDLDPAAGHLLEIPTGAADRAAGAHAGYEVGDPAVGLRPDLGAGGFVVARRIVRVGVLVRLPGALDLADEPVRGRVVGVGVVRLHGGRTDDDAGPVRGQHVPLVLADLVRADEDAVVALGLGDDGQPDAGVAAGGLDDGAARLEQAVPLGRLDHLDRDPVLHRATRVEVLDLGQDETLGAVGDRTELEQRGVADEVDERVHVLHKETVSTATASPRRRLRRDELSPLWPRRPRPSKLARAALPVGSAALKCSS